MKTFFAKVKHKPCFYCKKTFKNTRYNHQCSVRPSCLICKRHLAIPGLLPSKYFSRSFYYRGDPRVDTISCSICNALSLSVECSLAHKKICCKKGSLLYRCPDCKRYIFRTKKLKNAEQIAKNHKYSCTQNKLHN